jgi:hypothetical protein
VKDPIDTVTAELPLAPRRPGRPSTGAAKSAAERKRDQRKRDRHVFASAASAGTYDLSSMTVGSLCEGLARYVNFGAAALAASFMQELAKRVNENDALRTASEPVEWQATTVVTVTKKVTDLSL